MQNSQEARCAMPRAVRASDAAILDYFRSALVARGIIPPEPIVADGRLHRCDASGPRGRGDAAYLLHLDGVPTGGLENWRDGEGWETWRHDGGQALTPTEREACVRLAKAARAARDEEVGQRHALARHAAARIWAASRPAPHDHLYLARKTVGPLGLRVFKGVLVVPVLDLAGPLHSLQFISAGGAKRFLKGGRIQGLSSWIGEPPDPTGGGPHDDLPGRRLRDRRQLAPGI